MQHASDMSNPSTHEVQHKGTASINPHSNCKWTFAAHCISAAVIKPHNCSALHFSSLLEYRVQPGQAGKHVYHVPSNMNGS
jgi:hypothetical protein